ncbi:hypothetical protein BD310DRAFT_772157, partial [Dichomitus squalens]
LIQETDSKLVLGAVTERLRENEDTGYIGKRNVELTKAVVASLRRRKAPVGFKWVKGHSGHTRNEGADRLAGAGAIKGTPDVVDVTIQAELQLSGAKLQAMTQRRAYIAIMARKAKKVSPRPRTVFNLDMVKAGLENQCGAQVTDKAIWKSLTKGSLFTKEIRRFLWMGIHNAYMIGGYWLRDNMSIEMQARATCSICGETESMSHIL